MSLSSEDRTSQSSSPATSNHSNSSQGSTSKQKTSYCQRCLNHRFKHDRKGHKPFCQYATCSCENCRMVEERRQINNGLAKTKKLLPREKPVKGEKKIRDPKCARCQVHGEIMPLRGHKKSACPYENCKCHLCNRVQSRRVLMAKQVKLRREQQKTERQEKEGSVTKEINDETKNVLKTEEIESSNDVDHWKTIEEPSAPSPPVLAPKAIWPISPSITGLIPCMPLSTPLATTPPVCAPMSLPQPLPLPNSHAHLIASSSTISPLFTPWEDVCLMLLRSMSTNSPQTQFSPTPLINPYMLGFGNPYLLNQI